MRQFNKWATRLSGWANHVTAALMLSMFVVFLLQIIFRYFLGWPVLWTVEWVTIAWLWTILFGFAFVVSSSDMIRLDIICSSVPRGARRVFDVITGLTCAGIFLYTLPAAWDYVTFMEIERTAAFRWSFDWVFGIYIPFHVAVIVRMLMLAMGGIFGTRARENVDMNAETHDYD